MPFLSAELAKKLLPAFVGIILLLIVGFVAYGKGKDAGDHSARAELQPKLDLCNRNLTTARGNAARLKVAVDEQSAATKRLAQIEADRLAASSAELAAAERRAVGARATIEKLKASAASASGDPCQPSDAALETWK